MLWKLILLRQLALLWKLILLRKLVLLWKLVLLRSLLGQDDAQRPRHLRHCGVRGGRLASQLLFQRIHLPILLLQLCLTLKQSFLQRIDLGPPPLVPLGRVLIRQRLLDEATVPATNKRVWRSRQSTSWESPGWENDAVIILNTPTWGGNERCDTGMLSVRVQECSEE